MAKVMISLPEGFLSEIDKAAQAEHRTRSDLIREALREYFRGGKRPKNPIENPRVREAFETLRSLNWKEKFDSTEVIRKMRDNRYSE
ncbi:MAG: ribbon-helix-helix protein, CopG family [Deltaproteobacteria bacterium]|nr:ribbon-helix-helix protein, CopG family [Deltaproteobacteria bacterium]